MMHALVSGYSVCHFSKLIVNFQQWLAHAQEQAPTATPSIAESSQLVLKNGILSIQIPEHASFTFRTKQGQSGSLICDWEQSIDQETGFVSAFIGGTSAKDAYHYRVSSGPRAQLQLFKSNQLIDQLRLDKAINLNTFHHYQMKRDQGKISLSIDQQLVHSFYDPHAAYSNNQHHIGFYFLSNQQTQLKNVFVQRKKLPTEQGVDAIAAAYYAQGHYETALAHYRSIQQRFTNAAVAQDADYFEARCLSALNQHTDARELYGKFSQQHPLHHLAAYAAQHYVVALAYEGKWSQCEDALVNLQNTIETAGLYTYTCTQLHDVLKQQTSKPSPSFTSLHTTVNEVIASLP